MKSLPKKEQEWFEHLLSALSDSGSTGRKSAKYIRQKNFVLGFSRQESTGAAWFDWRRLRFGIFMNAEYADRPPSDPWLYALLAHEAKHREQGLLEALSVRGELMAWQLQYDILEQSSAAPTDSAWQEIRRLDSDSRADLQRARTLMKEAAGPGYRIDLLPLWPLPAEVGHRLRAWWRRLVGS